MIDHRRIVAETLAPPPKQYGVTQWSSRQLGRHLGISNGTIASAWRDCGVQPWPVETFKSPPTPRWSPRWSTWSGYIWHHRRTRSMLCIDELGRAEAR